MKIGDVARETGLTEKAIRIYVEQGLVKPTVTQSTHRNSYDFSRENVHELERISIFRKAGFSLFEISVIQQEPERLPELLESKRQSMETELEAQQSVREALDRLQASQVGNVQDVAEALRHAVANRKEPKVRGSRRWIYVTFIVTFLVGTYLWLHYIGWYKSFYGGYGWVPLEPWQEIMIGGILCMILTAPCLFMAVRYGTCARRANRLPQRATGVVTKVLEEHGFDGRFARAGTGGAGTREPGIGGTWQVHFMLWNEIRPDCWFPVIRYTDENGKERSNSFTYGGFKNSWKEGDRVEIAWDPRDKGYIHPREGRWLKQKALLYAIVGLVFLALTIWLFALLMSPEYAEAYSQGSYDGFTKLPGK